MPTYNYALIVVSLLLLAVAAFIVYFILWHNRTAFRAELEKQHILAQQEKELLSHTIAERDRTLDNVSRELHDHFSQLLRLLQMNLHMVSDLSVNDAQKRYLSEADRLAEMVASQAHDISRSLSSEYIAEKGLISMVRYDIKRLEDAGLAVRFTMTGAQQSLAPDRELAVYRIFQEGVGNVLRHANASDLAITLDYGDQGLEIILTDNGIGFTALTAKTSGQGHRNMMHRAQFVGGVLTIRSAPAAGTKLILFVPYTANSPVPPS